MPHKRAKRSVRLAETAKKGSNLPPSSSIKDDAPRGALRILNAGKVQAAFRATGRISSEDTGERRPRPSKLASTSASTAGPSGTNKQKRSDKSSHLDSVKGKAKGKGRDLPSILPNETLGAYNRRIEALLRPGVSKAIKDANSVRTAQEREEREAKQRRIRKAQGKEVNSPDEEGGDGEGRAGGRKGTGKDDGANEWKFEDRPIVILPEKVAPRRLNDIVQAPPSLPKLKAAPSKVGAWNVGVGAGGGSGGSGLGVGRTPLNAGQARLLQIERERVIKQYRDMKAARETERDGKDVRADKGKGGADAGGKKRKVEEMEDPDGM